MRVGLSSAFLLLLSGCVVVNMPEKFSYEMEKNEKEIVEHLESYIDKDPVLKDKPIEVSSGSEGCYLFSRQKTHNRFALKEAQRNFFKKDDEKEGNNLLKKVTFKKVLRVLYAPRWLDAFKKLNAETVLVVPRHIYQTDERFQQLANPCCLIEGVLSTRTKEATLQQPEFKTQLEKLGRGPYWFVKTPFKHIVVLGGDVKKEENVWTVYDGSMIDVLLKKLPKNESVLFLKSPTTDRMGGVSGYEGVLVASRIQKEIGWLSSWCMPFVPHMPYLDVFNFLLPSVLKTCLEDPNVTLFLPEENVELLSEAQRLGIKVVCYPNPACTASSEAYVASLNAKNRIVLLKNWKGLPVEKMSPQSDQAETVVRWLKERLKAKRS